MYLKSGTARTSSNEQAHHPVIASIDLGTNSCRLLIGRINIASFRKGPFRSSSKSIAWKVLDSFGRITRLGEKLDETGELSPEAIDRAMEVLHMCHKRLSLHEPYRLRVVATEACRQASNAHILVERAKRECGFQIEIISNEEEARLSLTGCAAVLNPQIPYAVMFDIGGGSTECIWLELDPSKRARPGYPIPFQVIDTLSLPFGVITLSERVAELKPQQMFEAVRESIEQVLEPFVRVHRINELCARGDVQLIGSSGTITTLAAIRMGMSRYERRFIDGVDLEISEFQDVIQELLALSAEERATHPCIGFGRENLVVVGAAVLQGICDAVNLPKVRVADRGVREGVLVEMLSQIYRRTGHA